jgi:cytochrome c oxidase assembly protein subunit 15
MPTESPTETASPWPRRAAWWALALTFPIFLIGGTVTTLRVGMAVPDWPTTFGHNMFTYPLSEMLGDRGVFWEHTHRLWGSLVGLAVLAAWVAVLRFEARGLVRLLATAAFLGVCAQGVLGGLRVTQASPELAFLHGAFAQALFALLAALVALYTPYGRSAGAGSPRVAGRALAVAVAAVGIVFVQTVLGAWLRHSGADLALVLHIVLALLATGAVVLLASELRRAGAPALARAGRWLFALVWIQVALGLAAAVWIYVVTGPHNPVSVGEAVFATAHVACGALLLACASAALALLLARRAATAPEGVRAAVGAPGHGPDRHGVQGHSAHAQGHGAEAAQ